MATDLERIMIDVVRKTDKQFEQSGGGTGHWVKDCFLPRLESAGYRVVHHTVADENAELRAELERVNGERDELIKDKVNRQGEEIQCLYEIREIFEEIPGKLMQEDLVAHIRAEVERLRDADRIAWAFCNDFAYQDNDGVLVLCLLGHPEIRICPYDPKKHMAFTLCDPEKARAIIDAARKEEEK